MGDGQHLAMECLMTVDRGEVFLRAAEMQSVFAEQPFTERTLFGILDGLKSAVAERLTHPDCQQQGDLPPHVAGDGIPRSHYLLRDIWNGRHFFALN